MTRFLKTVITITLSIAGIMFAIIPESCFKDYALISFKTESTTVMFNRVICCIGVFIVVSIICGLHLKFRRKITIKGRNYCIEVQYGDLFKQKKCKRVIDFDECFTNSVGATPSEINADSICGQYLKANPIDNIHTLIDASGLRPSEKKSAFQAKECYPSGSILPKGDDLLMAFAKLDPDGLGRMTRDEYIDSLSLLWKEIDKFYGQKDVCIPVIGSGVTRIDDATLSQQELLDIVIASYRLSSKKIKIPNKLRIICKRRDDFSLNKVGESF